MAYSSVFDFHSGATILHRLDVRFKLVILILFNLAISKSGIIESAILSCIFLLLVVRLQIPFKSVLMEIRVFLLLLLLVFVARSLSESGTELIPGWIVTVEGVRDGSMVCWRLVLIIFAGLIFIRTSRPWEIKTAIFRFLNPIPKLPAHRISLMVSLMFRFIPMVMETYNDISEAQQSRGVGFRKNPLFRLKVLVIPLLENTFRKADEMVLAMEARCYSDDRTDPELCSRREDWLALALAVVGCASVMVF